MTRFTRFLWVFFACWGAGVARADAPAEPEPEVVQLPSTVTTGNPAVDTIRFEWYAPQHIAAGSRAPAIVALHSLGGDINVPRGFARYFSQRGVGAAVVELPYHFHRALPGVSPASRFVGSDSEVVALSWKQSYADVSSVLTWLEARPDVDPNRLGANGVSLGAITIHGVMGQDPRIKAAVTFVGGGDFPYIYQNSTLLNLSLGRRRRVGPEDIATLQPIDPLALAPNNRPRRVLMIQAARDLVIPPYASKELWNALGRPPIRWVDCGHFGLNLALPQAHRAAFAFLQSAWNDAEQNGEDTSRLRAPKIYIPTLKAGLLSGLDSNLTPAVTVQVASLGTRPDHLAWVHADVGFTGRGPYVGLAATITSFVDIGYGRRLGGRKFRPYIGTQVAF